MPKPLSIGIAFTAILLALLLIPLDGQISNTIFTFIGRFHPLLLHLPIGGLMALFVMEIMDSLYPKLNLGAACYVLLWFSIITILPTAILGFLLATNASYDDELLNIHKWLGWITALSCCWLYYFKVNSPQNGTRRYKSFLGFNVLFLSLTGHFGGQLTHGKDYFTKYMPEGLKYALNIAEEKEYILVQSKVEINPEEEGVYRNQIQPIIENYCYKCHGKKKQKGNLRFDTIDWDMINGVDAEKWSMMLNEINLGEMPPEDQDQLSGEERRKLVDWISTHLNASAQLAQADNKMVMRRQTKSQYTNSLQDLLGVEVNFGDVLPDDGLSKMGYSNNGNVLQTSALHIDYFQKIARKALDKAIVSGEKPAPKRYKVILGKNKGDGVSGAEFGGYQTAPINNEDFSVQVLDGNGNPKTDRLFYPDDLLKHLKNNIGIGMRGSASNRYHVVEEGMILNAALPAKEVTPKSWQGPSPNLKLLIKEAFPREGRYAFRVEASKGYHYASNERLIDLRENDPMLDETNSIRVLAKKLPFNQQFVLQDNKWLKPKAFANFVETEFTYTIPKEGIYKIELVHPYVSKELMPSYHISFFGRKEEGVISKRLTFEKLKGKSSGEEMTTAVTLAYLSKGKHKGFIGGKFFVGFSELRFIPIAETDPLPKILATEVRDDNSKFLAENPSLLAFAGSRTDDGMDYKSLDAPIEVDVPFGESQVYEFTGRLENLPIPMGSDEVSGELANILTFGVWNNHLVKESSLNGPPLLIKSVEFEAPYFPSWPPASHTKIFFDSPSKNTPEKYAKEVIEKFMVRAFRRNLNPEELNRYMNFWKSIHNQYNTFEDSIKEVLVAVLCSPNFIYINQPLNTKNQEFHLASQLSYFLWNAPPDQKLLTMASEKKLHRNLSTQINRMIDSPKIDNLIVQFAYEWLRLDRHKNMDVNVESYEDYTRFVKEDMFRETFEFIKYILKNDLSILNFIDSDFAMLNQNLAEFYGIQGVQGNTFRPVKLTNPSLRGGLLSQGSFLTGHSDGLQAHAIKRGVWIKEKILGDPPPPPPPNVPELDPEKPGFENLSLKEQLFLHRNKVSCMDCHRKIDPYGVVFENYDASGRHRLTFNGEAIDSNSILPDGTEVTGIQGIKNYILEHKSQDFVKSLVKNLFAYATGRDYSFKDEKEINRIVNNVIRENYKFRTVIKEIIESPAFYSKEK